MPKISEYTLPISLYKWLVVVCTHSIGQIYFQYYLHKCSFFKKQVKSTLKELKGVFNIQNSTNKSLNSSSQVFTTPTFTDRFRAFYLSINLNPRL